MSFCYYFASYPVRCDIVVPIAIEVEHDVLIQRGGVSDHATDTHLEHIFIGALRIPIVQL